jgi:hypothetical protein
MAFNDSDNPFALTKQEERYIATNSVERMINTAIRLGEFCQNNPKLVGEEMSELGSINWQDFQDLKEVMCKLWNERRNDIFKRDLEK